MQFIAQVTVGAHVVRLKGHSNIYVVTDVDLLTGTFKAHPLLKPKKILEGLLPGDFKKVVKNDSPNLTPA